MTSSLPTPLPLTGERTVPGVARENYWFRRHEVAYDWILDRFGPEVSRGVVVDAGCGEGYGADKLAKRLEQRDSGSQVVAVDLDLPSLTHVAAKYPQLAVVAGNLDSLPFATDSIDALVTMQVIEHLWDLRGFLGEVRRVLRPGGLFIAATPNRLTFSPGLARGEKPTNPFHVEEFDSSQLVQLIQESKFTSVQAFGLFHGVSLNRWEAQHGNIVSAQVEAVLSDNWPIALEEAVAQIRTSDFEIRETDLDHAADLLAIARA